MIPLSLRRTTVLKNRRSLLETSSLSCIPAPSKNVSSHNWSVIVRSTDTDTAVPKLSFRAGGKGRKKRMMYYCMYNTQDLVKIVRVR